MRHFMTISFAWELGLKIGRVNMPISGKNKSETQVKRLISAKIIPKSEQYEKTTKFSLLTDICNAVPLNFLHNIT